MKKTFKSKVDLLLLLPIVIVFLTAEIFMIVNGFVIAIILFGLAGTFITYLYLDTRYVVTEDNKLQVKSGFLYQREIYIKSIKKVRPSEDRTTSPALSLDRLEICYNRYGRIVVSPDNKTEFIKVLKNVNPRIRVEESNHDSSYHSIEKRLEELFAFRRNK